MSMETRHLQIFCAVYRTRSFTRAAEELYTSQPTISEHMKNLEDRLGCLLFDRLGRTIAPTPEADMLYPKAAEILAELKRLESTLASAAKTMSGEIVIAASTIPGEYILPSRAAAFNNKHSDVSFEILIKDSALVIEDVGSGRVYLGVVGVELPSTKTEFAPCGGDELVLAAAPDWPINDTIDGTELLKHAFLARERGSGTGRNVELFLGQIGVAATDLKIRAILGSSTAIKEAVKSGLGVAVISKTAIRDELADGALKIIEVRGLSMKRSFYVVTPKRRSLPHHYQVFREFLLSNLG
jgi:DNA-binding transcriptional LysR family regulator